MFRFKLIIFFLLIFNILLSQNNIKIDGYNIFYHENGKISSEGFMRDGKPDGYWKTYNKSTVLISEGNRKNFKLDSTWKFYNDTGNIILEINYKKGKKDGIRKIYREKEIINENFKNDIKNGLTQSFYPNGKLKRSVNFIDGLEEGICKEYTKNERIITLFYYKKGFIIDKENINRFDQQNKKHGIWKYYYPDGKLKLVGKYKHGKKEGFFKEYSNVGDLAKAEKFTNGIIQENVAKLKKLDVKKDYYKNGKVKIVASYKDGVPEGIRREYSEDGTIENSYIFKNGVIIGKGIITKKGERDGFWNEYFDNGDTKAKGNYNKDIKTGEWKYYHKNGKLEQDGNFEDNGKLTGKWRWYYKSGRLLREEFFSEGLSNSVLSEYNEHGSIITQGEYFEGLKNGFWTYKIGDNKEEGEYIDGKRNGIWKHYFNNGKKSFEGKFIDDNPNGLHTYFWDNGNKKDEGFYVMGKKDGEWVKYNYDGTVFMKIYYKNGVEKRYDGIKISSDFK
ncbi:MAG: hypothetical protein K8R41_05005 [Bacteroidales bacterium]|nr:hypothetical protein [Bacteroidales bacterium]